MTLSQWPQKTPTNRYLTTLATTKFRWSLYVNKYMRWTLLITPQQSAIAIILQWLTSAWCRKETFLMKRVAWFPVKVWDHVTWAWAEFMKPLVLSNLQRILLRRASKVKSANVLPFRNKLRKQRLLIMNRDLSRLVLPHCARYLPTNKPIQGIYQFKRPAPSTHKN